MTSVAEWGLFGPVDPPAEPVEKVSAGRRLTLRQRADVDRGIHPLTGTPTHPELGTCGDCVHRVHRNNGTAGTYPKCAIGPGAASVTTDVRAWWPACSRHTPVTP